MKTLCLLALSISVTNPEAIGQKKDSLPIYRRWSDSQSGVEKAGQKTVKTKKEWKKLWESVHRNVNPKPKLPKVDFQKHSIVAVFMGQKPTAGYNTKIEKVHKRKKTIVISYRETSPPADAITASVITTPYSMVQIDRISKKVRFHQVQKTK